MKRRNYIAPVFALAMLSGCATHPPYPVAENFREQAKPVTVTQVTLDPDGTRGTTVIWGGIILDAVNDTNGGAIYVLEMPLDPNDTPNRNSAPTGQFIATTSQNLDLETYSNYRLITVAGKVTGVRTRTVGNVQYTCPVVDIEDIHVWPLFPKNFESYGTPAWTVAPGWWWYGGTFYPPRNPQSFGDAFCNGYGE